MGQPKWWRQIGDGAYSISVSGTCMHGRCVKDNSWVFIGGNVWGYLVVWWVMGLEGVNDEMGGVTNGKLLAIIWTSWRWRLGSFEEYHGGHGRRWVWRHLHRGGCLLTSGRAGRLRRWQIVSNLWQSLGGHHLRPQPFGIGFHRRSLEMFVGWCGLI